MEDTSAVSALLTGIVVGAVGRSIVPGRKSIGWILALALSLAGAFAGGYIAHQAGFTLWWRVLGVQALMAALPVLVTAGLQRRHPNQGQGDRS